MTTWKLYECERGRRWSSTDEDYAEETCGFSGCLPDHKVKFVKETTDGHEAHVWFCGWPKWEDTPKHKSLFPVEVKYNEAYWEKRLATHVPEKVKNAIKRIYNAYPPDCLPQGLADPMYIMNVIALELGIGDGKGQFNI